MKVFLDTSVLVASVVQEHESHARCFAVIDGVQSDKDEGVICAHSLAEIYGVLTKLPRPMRHSPAQAILSIEENVVKYFDIVALTAADYTSLVREAALTGIQGGTIHDAVLLKCAEKAAPERIFTLNLRHFQSIASRNIGSRIVAP